MKDLKQCILENLKLKFNLNDFEYRKHLKAALRVLDPTDSIAGMNCWDLTWAFAKYCKDILGIKHPVECASFEGRHYVPVITLDNGEKWMIDFTFSNQHHFNNGVVPFNSNPMTKEGWKVTELFDATKIPEKIKNIEMESPEDLFGEFNDIFDNVQYFN